MNRSGGTGFSRTETDYSVLVPAAASSLKITVQTHTDSPRYGDTDNGYLVSVNGKNVGIVENAGAVEVPLNGTETDEEIKIVVTNIYNQNAHTEYRLTIKKAATTAVAFQTNPKNALIYIYEQGVSGRQTMESSRCRKASLTIAVFRCTDMLHRQVRCKS